MGDKEVCAAHEMTLKSFEQFQENQKEIVGALSDLRERLVIAEQSTKSAHHRLDSQEKQTEAIIKMSSSIEHMAEKVEEMLGELKDHDDRLDDLERMPPTEMIQALNDQSKRIDELERAPGNNLVMYWRRFIFTIIACIAGGVFAFLAKGGI